MPKAPPTSGVTTRTLVQRQAELRGEDFLHLVGHLMRMMHGEPVAAAVELGNDGARLQRHAGLPLEGELMLDDDGGVAERRVRVADGESVIEAQIAGHRAVHGRRAPARRRVSIVASAGNSSQSIVDQLDAHLRPARGSPPRPRRRLALPARFPARERMLRRRDMPGSGASLRLPGLADRGELVAGHDRDHAGSAAFAAVTSIAAIRA